MSAGQALLARLDAADRLPGAAELRALSYDLFGVGSGGAVVDVGCGGGRGVAEPAGRGVRAMGVDPSERMIAVARGRWPGADFRVGDACRLPPADGVRDGYRADKVCHELAEPERALAQARRVLAPGGRIVLRGQDRTRWSSTPAIRPSPGCSCTPAQTWSRRRVRPAGSALCS
ncbi:methyltransferase domain-containing protein [Streptomyces sp. NPDC006012]|uniref:methyltransferase domain-containing protein n=1 Tax=Streptomyces sp. NPDC006012 TaxID=3364739 RepID=UPI00367B40AE